MGASFRRIREKCNKYWLNIEVFFHKLCEEVVTELAPTCAVFRAPLSFIGWNRSNPPEWYLIRELTFMNQECKHELLYKFQNMNKFCVHQIELEEVGNTVSDLVLRSGYPRKLFQCLDLWSRLLFSNSESFVWICKLLNYSRNLLQKARKELNKVMSAKHCVPEGSVAVWKLSG